ncbi:conjugal transfer protein TrbL family protein [Oscillibacter sp.]|uniref:conjugal transfer protein TrbL family protein n=1 Tax=Oscillibacter sp. TaxID=1945593 RepID=UPI00289F7016|nr:conjugal transfer protein TrbL family protein [Oscillibacter sp.]
MFIWDFVAGSVLDDIMDWVYGHIIGFLAGFFTSMSNMGAELFDISWVQSIVLFFDYLAWALYVVGLVVAIFDTAINFQNGRGSIKETGLNAIKGFLAASLFSTVPVELYKLAISLQSELTAGLTGSASNVGDLASEIVTTIQGAGSTIAEVQSSDVLTGMDITMSPILLIFIIILMGYAVIKIFFANLKRGGILLIMISVGSLYLFSVPRGYIDGFVSWCKQIVGLCLTAFLQSVMLVAGLMLFPDNVLLGLGLMLAASEIPRIAGQFGLDTSTKGNVMSAVYGAQAAVNITKSITQVVAK